MRQAPPTEPQAWPDIPTTARQWNVTARWVKERVQRRDVESVLLDRVRVNPASMAAFFESRRREAVAK